jgi:hypothetical protein
MSEYQDPSDNYAHGFTSIGMALAPATMIGRMVAEHFCGMPFTTVG